MAGRTVTVTIEAGLPVKKAGPTFHVRDGQPAREVGRLIVNAFGIKWVDGGHGDRSGTLIQWRRFPQIEWRKLIKGTNIRRCEAAPTEAETQKAAKARTGTKRNKWTPEIKKKYLAEIKARKTTCAAIAKELGITPQTVWAQLKRKR